MKKYIVELTREQREELSHMISGGKASARDLMHARILLKADQGPQGPGWSDARIAEALEVNPRAETLRDCGRAGSHPAGASPTGAPASVGRHTGGALDRAGV